ARPLMAAMRRRLLAGLVALEAAALGGVLLLYRAMDSSRGAGGRGQLGAGRGAWESGAVPPDLFQLRVYYKSNEWAGIHGIKENDQMAWLSNKN
uniref:Uncharacterized protein n=1 Tax=Anas platyrhynchos platyrhynchos TaxID=8840 RepID=A0A493TJY7_ANAPP